MAANSVASHTGIPAGPRSDGFDLLQPLEPRRMLALSPIGGEFHANTHVTADQVFADVAADADGDFVVVWRSDLQDGDAGGIYAQRYSAAGTPQGGEFRVNTVTAGNQMNPSVAMDDLGNFVVTWEDSASGKGIMGQRFNAAG